MTRQFCDVCGNEIFGDNKFEVSLSNGVNEFDVCFDCRKAFKEARNRADIEVFKERSPRRRSKSERSDNP